MNLKKWAQWLLAMFGSSYCCESAFSAMKYTKSKCRSNLGDQQLADNVGISLSGLHPNLASIVADTKEDEYEDEEKEEDQDEYEEEEEELT